MSGVLKWSVPAVLTGILLTACSPASAQEVTHDEVTKDREESWYREQPTYKANTRALVQQKAQIRAEQRQARLASSAWYGMTNLRPNGAPTPFTSRYSPLWEMPGGRPLSWTPYPRTGYATYWR